MVEAIIALPPKMVVKSAISVAILLIRTGRPSKDVHFIDATRGFQYGKIRNSLRASDIEAITALYQARVDTGHSARTISVNEIFANDCNLTVERYLLMPEQEETVDLPWIRAERRRHLDTLTILEERYRQLSKEANYD